MDKVVIIIQARMSSSRLPGKVLKPLCGKPIVNHVVERASRAKLAQEVVIATSTDPSDDVLFKHCQENSIKCSRGSLNNVLDRYVQAGKEHKADIVVRVTSDCPLIDPEVIDKVISAFKLNNADYAANNLVRKYPRGLDTEVVSFPVLEKIQQFDLKPYHTEHVTPYIYENKEQFSMVSVEADDEWAYPDWRWCVDEPDDFEFVRRVYDGVYPSNHQFLTKDVFEFIKANPSLPEINLAVQQKTLH